MTDTGTDTRVGSRHAWADALKSGRYRQGRSALRRGDTYCCLGVLCDVYRERTGLGDWDGDAFVLLGAMPATTHPPLAVVRWIGLADESGRLRTSGRPLTDINDDGTPFDEIAALIEAGAPFDDPEDA